MIQTRAFLCFFLSFVCQSAQVSSFLAPQPTQQHTASTTRTMTDKVSQHVDNDDDSVRILGVCGGIGSGKSTVCQVLVSGFDCLGHIGESTIAGTMVHCTPPMDDTCETACR